ncbi:MAG: 4-hydroxy-tetrahydrodipicolinate reductase [Sulfobacillus thermosulfidooxidans]|uniref:4-hydroxy-tetrahydrodipicolinate reductase n=1 Tax=Sulfobacillus TaxID=28033 RepID=UPI000CD27D78|nr:4-hydroxy-tetrahydrodipicolinate reductase [Sulfobacillus sp. hq2]POB10692.1 4-hydroxy-tetrahydrodipicolinate reductase [Sulfobacillus sp. hq2]PSR36499.1 MAG: 4-hydroxy-tetrahydrodipicolinate reductase [Sulfobacillus thermosulfidooxidans]
MATKIPVVLAGATGKTGKEVGRAIAQAQDMELIGAVGHSHVGMALSDLWSEPGLSVVIRGAVDTIDASYAVLVDFTEPTSAYSRILEATARGWDLVVGTTGFSPLQLDAIHDRVQHQQNGAVLIANFSLGAWIMERLAQDASRYLDQAEVIEAHAATKRDRPSGTAKRMARLLADGWGRSVEDIPVHSIRLPGMVAHQAVIFGSSGQTLTLRHDVHDRSAYAAGVLAAIRRVHEFRGKVVQNLGDVIVPD